MKHCNTEAEQKILSLAPIAVQEAERILRNPKTSLSAQIQVIDLILNRTYGRPEGVLKLVDALEELEDVQDVYMNADIAEDAMPAEE